MGAAQSQQLLIDPTQGLPQAHFDSLHGLDFLDSPEDAILSIHARVSGELIGDVSVVLQLPVNAKLGSSLSQLLL